MGWVVCLVMETSSLCGGVSIFELDYEDGGKATV